MHVPVTVTYYFFVFTSILIKDYVYDYDLFYENAILYNKVVELIFLLLYTQIKRWKTTWRKVGETNMSHFHP